MKIHSTMRAGRIVACSALLVACGGEPVAETAEQPARAARRAPPAAPISDAGAEHALRWAGGIAEASHPSMPLRVRFDAGGAALSDPGAVPSWSGTLRAAAIGRDGEMRALGSATPEPDGSRVIYRREGALEWFLYGPLGVEHGLRVDARPRGEGPLVVELELGALRPELDGDRVMLSDGGGVRLVMSDLFVADAHGAALDARFEARDGRLRYVVEDAGAAYPIEIDPLVGVPTAVLRASDAASNDGLGYSVAIDGDTVVAGATLHDHSGRSNAGSAYVFVRVGSTWAPQAILHASDAATEDRFGQSVAISGDTIAVGAADDDHGGFLGAGSVYVFVRSGSTWTEQAILRASMPSTGAALGFSVAIDGDTIVAGALRESHPSITRAGSAYVFVRSGTTWSEQAILRASDAAADDYLGSDVAIDGDTAIVGAWEDDHSGFSTNGSAYVFVRSGMTWSEQAILRASDTYHWAYFGGSVDLDADTAIVGAFGQWHSGLPEAGSAYVFTRTGTAWSEQGILRASDAASGDDLGASVAIEGDVAIAGANGVSVGGVAGAGSVYAFERAGSTWAEASAVRPPAPEAAAAFGFDVSLSGETAIAGAFGDDSPGLTNAGAVHVIALREVGRSCSGPSDCASGFCVDGVCCDGACGGGSATDCAACSIAAGAAADGVCGPVAAGRVCRSAAGTCDVEEQCDGASIACPADAFASAGTECRASAGGCDVAEACTGASASCPSNGFQPSTTICRPAASVCDAEERCTGSGPACPFDLPASASVVCRVAADVCDTAEHCTGTTFACPPDAVAGAGTSCRAAAGPCDLAESCDGSSPACPADLVASAGTTCRPAVGACDAAESCDGAGAACPADAMASAGTLCRAAAGACDAAESCTGTGATCPADLLALAGTVCRAATGACDVAESCDGSAAACPADALAASSVVCRAASSACDAEETCTGTDAACPSDATLPDGAECDDALACSDGVCAGGSCTSSALDCDDGDPCTADGCEEPSGCFHDPIVACASDAGVLDAGAVADAGGAADAGGGTDAGGGDAGGGADAGEDRDAGDETDAGGDPPMVAGCGCRAARAPTAPSTLVLVMMIACARILRRARRSRQRGA